MGYPRILCPHHKEDTASCVIYPSGEYHCYGCGAHGNTKTLKGLEDGTIVAPVEKADLEAELKRISSLPTKTIRGLTLPYDDAFYYIVWPGGRYYKKRAITERPGLSKYLCPTGHSKPVFFSRSVLGSPVLIVVEGEINALSIRAACPQYDLWCPGGAGDFYSKSLEHRLQAISFGTYVRVYTFCDRDPAGAIACIKFKALAKTINPNVNCQLMPKDANDILQESGKEGLSKEIRRLLGMSERMQGV